LGILITLVVSLLTASFRDVGLPKAVWEALFVTSAILCVVWLAWAVIQACRAPSIEDVVARLKTSSASSSA